MVMGGVGMSRSRPFLRLTGWYGTAEASPPISPAASPDHNYATAGTKAPQPAPGPPPRRTTRSKWELTAVAPNQRR